MRRIVRIPVIFLLIGLLSGVAGFQVPLTGQATPAPTQKAATKQQKQGAEKATSSPKAQKHTPAKKQTSQQAAAAKKQKAQQTAPEKKQNVQRATAAVKQKTAPKKAKAAQKKKPTPPPYKSAVLFNAATEKTVFSRNSYQQIPPASLTKILSMYVAMDIMKQKKISSATQIKVSPRAADAKGSRMGLRPGEKVSLEELLRGLAIASGNDAAVALAEYFGGTEKKFVAMMNKKARQIGMKNSVFKNASGLPAKGQYTTAADMLLLARSYMKAYPAALTTYHNQRVNVHQERGVSVNSNPLLGSFQGADGLKTGYVAASGYNLIATAKRGNVRLIGVILGCPSGDARAKEATALMEKGFGTSGTNTADGIKKAQKKSAAVQAPSGSKKTSGKNGSGKKTHTTKADVSLHADKASGGKSQQTKKQSAASKSKQAVTRQPAPKQTTGQIPSQKTAPVPKKEQKTQSPQPKPNTASSGIYAPYETATPA